MRIYFITQWFCASQIVDVAILVRKIYSPQGQEGYVVRGINWRNESQGQGTRNKQGIWSHHKLETTENNKGNF